MSKLDRFDDEELGFIAAAGQAAGKMLGGMGKGFAKMVKKKKKKKPAAAPAAKPDYLFGELSHANQSTETKEALAKIAKGAVKAKAKSKTGKAAPADIVKEIVAQVPPLVREQVLAALKAAKDSAASQSQTLGTITASVDDALKPDITAMVAALQAQGISKQATYEHDQLVNKANFERDTKDGLAGISARLDAMSKEFDLKLRNPKIAIVTQRLPVFGPKNVLEG